MWGWHYGPPQAVQRFPLRLIERLGSALLARKDMSATLSTYDFLK
jgi:hypothetical protein